MKTRSAISKLDARVRCGTGGRMRSVSARDRSAILCVLAPCLSAHVAIASSYSLDWDAIFGGGVSIAGRYTMVEILGQPDAGTATYEALRWEAGFLPGLNLQPAGNASNWKSDEDTLLRGTLGGSDWEGDQLTFALHSPTTHGQVDLLPDGTFTYKPDLNYNGMDTLTFRVNDGEFDGSPATATFTIDPVNDLPTVGCTPAAQTVQYSDPITSVTILANDVDSPGSSLIAATTWRKEGNGGSVTPGLPDGLALDLTTTTDDSRVWNLSGLAQVAPATYRICITVRDDNGAAGTADFILDVTPEDARATYNGALFASTASASSSLATVTLSATIQDITAIDPNNDSSAGDVRRATVTFINWENGTVIATNVPVGLISLSDPTTGTATCNWTVDIGAADSQSFTVGIIVNGWYTRDASDDDTVVTVSKPLPSDFVTGGGYLVLTHSAGLYAGDPGTKANFGFNVKYNKKGNNLQGRINIITRSAGRVYQVKGNVMNSLSIANNEATFNGKASIVDITDQLNPISIDGNATLQVVMTDEGDVGTTDSIAITVWNKKGGLWFASDWSGTRTEEQILDGGNLVVRSARKSSLTELPAVESIREEPFLLTIERLPELPTLPDSCRFVLRFPVTPKIDYALERSSDLVTWVHLTTVMSFTDAVEYFEEADSAAGCQFYRVRLAGDSPAARAILRTLNLREP